MSRNEAIESLKPTLTAAISDWVDKHGVSKEWDALSTYFGNDLVLLMADAAMAVLRAQVNLYRELEESGSLKS